MVAELATCPHCGASNPASAEWCGQCFRSFTDSSASAAVSAPPPDVGPRTSGWTCRACQAHNEVQLSECAVCGTSIYVSYGAGDGEREFDAGAAVRRAMIFPGFGYGTVGLGGIGLVSGFLAIASLVVGVMLLVAGELVGLVLLVVFVTIWGVSIVDVTRLAQGEGTPLLRPRVLSLVGGLVVALLFISVLLAFQDATS